MDGVPVKLAEFGLLGSLFQFFGLFRMCLMIRRYSSSSRIMWSEKLSCHSKTNLSWMELMIALEALLNPRIMADKLSLIRPPNLFLKVGEIFKGENFSVAGSGSS